jgi:hypothetical protein
VAVARLHDTTDLSVSLTDGLLKVDGSVAVYGALAQWPSAQPLTEAFLHRVEHEVSRRIAADIGQAITTANRAHEDPFGFGRQWLLSHPAKLSVDTPTYWAHIPIATHLTVTCAITVSGVQT